ncbi:translocation/assembly module TamB domain-containing protein [Kingella kingae]|uniref:translocation/assembly module TamB domain-containing protein n=1 Tax=Kingella kingae TaxID=504 RepID=UPI00040BBC19|nr:translocation/assembly module TamB domain-containing protein [Kingella kingae]
MTDTHINPTPEPETSAPKSPKKRRWLKYTLGGVVVLLGTSAGALTWLLNTESGLRFAVYQLPKLGGVQITSRTLNGSILGGFSADKIAVQTPSADIQISQLQFAWQPNALWQRHLHVQKLHAGDIHIDNKATPPEPNRPKSAPLERIQLPFTLALDSLQTGAITQGKDKTEILRGINASYVYNHEQHQLNVHSLRNHWSNTHGKLAMRTVAPFELGGTLLSDGNLDGIVVENLLDLSGSLHDLKVNTDLTGNGVGLHGSTHLRLFADNFGSMINHVKITGQGINPQAFNPSLPRGNLFFDIGITPNLNDNIALDGKLDLRNDTPEAADKNGLPIRTLQGEFHVNDSGAVEINQVQAALMQQGTLSLSGGVYAQKRTLNLTAKLDNITAADAISTAVHGKLNGSLHATGTFDAPQVAWQLNTGLADTTGTLKLTTDTQNAQQTLWIENGEIRPQDGGVLNVAGSLQLFQQQKLQAQIRSQAFNPAKLYPNFPEGNVNGTIEATGELVQQMFQGKMQFAPSTLSGAPLSGSGDIRYENNHLSRTNTQIKLGNNLINTQGAFGKRGDTLSLDINAPNLNLFGFGLQGLLTAKGTVTSTADSFTNIDAKLAGQLRQFAVGNQVKVQNADFTVQASPDPTRPLNVVIKGNGIVAGGTNIEQINAQLNGTQRQHQFNAQSSLHIDGKPLTLTAAANGGLNEQQQWQGAINTLDVGGALQLRLQNPMRLEAGAKRVSMSSARWQALGGSLAMDSFVWDAATGLTTKGNASSLHLSQLHNFYKPPVEHDLVIAADWDMAYSTSPRGFFNIKQQSGDVILPTARKQALNLNGFVLNSKLDVRGIHNQVQAATRYGKLSGNYNILQAFGQGAITAAPVSGSLQFDSENLETLRSFLPIGQTIKGKLVAIANISGQVDTPKLNGTLTGDQLHYRDRQTGIILDNGSLTSRFEGQKWLIEALQFKRKDGTITLSGSAAYANEAPDINAKVVFDRYQILDQASRRLTLSGSSDVLYTAQGISLNGTLKTDDGRFGFQESSAPTLDDDVVVLGETKRAPSAPLPFKLNLVFDLNDEFYFSGEGLNVQLGGQLTLKSTSSSDIQAVGSVNVVRGRYKAYGQDLIVKKGIVSFVGPLANPNLNIRAERRNSPVGAGVEVLGNVETPRITLVANEPMSEKDKLSWLVLNRASSGSSGDNAALATAASAFLAGSINDKIGLVDDFGLTSEQTRNATTGEMNPAQQVLTFGKQLTRDLYLGYEAGLQTSSQTIKLVYYLSRSFQAIARMGTVSSGAEIKYIRRFD